MLAYSTWPIGCELGHHAYTVALHATCPEARNSPQALEIDAGEIDDVVETVPRQDNLRVHPAQATAGVRLQSREHARKVDAMIEDAVFGCLGLLQPNIRQRLTSRWLAEASELRAFTRETARRSTRPFALRAGRTVGHLCIGSAAAREYVLSRLLRRAPTDWVRRRLASAGCWPRLIPIDTSVESRPQSPPTAPVSPPLETV